MATLEEMMDLKKRFEEAKSAKKSSEYADAFAGVGNAIANRPTYASIMLGMNPKRVDMSGFQGGAYEKPEDIASLYAKYEDAKQNRANDLVLKDKEIQAKELEKKDDRAFQEDQAKQKFAYDKKLKEMDQANKKDEEAAKASVPDFNIAAGARPTQKDAEEVKAGNQANRSIQNGLESMKSIISKSGPEMFGSNADSLNLIAEDTRLQAKNLYALGQLSKGDLEMLDRVIPSGTSWSDWSNVNAKERLLSRIDKAQEIMNKKLEDAATARGFVKVSAPKKDENAAAIAWLEANPDHPKAAAVRQKLGMPEVSNIGRR